jgi:hypothetical protein
MVVVEHSLKVRSKDRHVFFCIGGNVAIQHFHGLFVMGSVATREDADVFPRNSWVHRHVVDLGAKVSCPSGLGDESFVLDIFVEASERFIYCVDGRGREISRGAEGVDQLVAFVNQGGKVVLVEEEPVIALGLN